MNSTKSEHGMNSILPLRLTNLSEGDGRVHDGDNMHVHEGSKSQRAKGEERVACRKSSQREP